MNNSGSDWLVVFYRKAGSWYGRFVPGEFKHVALLRYYVETNSWLYLDMDFKGVHVTCFPGEDQAMAHIAKQLSDCAVISVKPGVYKFTIRGFMTCVSFAKHAIGFRNWRAFTPDQLYEALLSAGAEHLKS